MSPLNTTADTGTVSEAPTLAARWYVLIVMVLVYTMSIADRYAISTVQIGRAHV